jgi:hypothetical protein
MSQTGLTDTWAGIYLQVTSTILVFGLGIPAVIMQVIVPEDLRRIIHKRRHYFKKGVYLILVATFSSLFFIWVLRPYSDNKSGLMFLVSLGNNKCIQGIIKVCAENQLLISNILMTLTISSALIFWRLQAAYRRDRVLNYLKKECTKRINKKGIPDEEALLDISYLGEKGESGSEKELALEVLSQLVKKVLIQESYTGAGLKLIIKAINSTIQDNGDITDFQKGISILKKIIEELQIRGHVFSPDMETALNTIQTIGIVTLKKNYIQSALSILDAVTPTVQKNEDTPLSVIRFLFEFGKEAVEENKMDIAVAILSRFEGLVISEQLIANEKTANYLGLLAHFWEANSSARERARVSLAEIHFETTLKECIEESKKHHKVRARFDTVEKLDSMSLEREL